MKATDKQVVRKFVNLATSAKSRGIQFDMSLVKIRRLLNTKRCYFTNKLFNDSDNVRNIDRVNNDLGYIDSNVVACGERINQMKGSLSIRDIELLFKGIQKQKRKLVK